jgi:hypothetical protein
LSFTGVGYHDQNWGVKPLTESAKSWYWGHAQAGPYSLVWFDAIGIDGQEYVSGYVAWNGLLVQSSCEHSAVKVRPVGGVYPPTQTDAVPEGYTLEYDLGMLGILQFNVSVDLPLEDSPSYFRYMGKTLGGKIGEEVFEGKAVGEQLVN